MWIYSALYEVTSKGKDIFSAQVIFTVVYLTTLAVTLSLYRTAKVTNDYMKMLTSGPSVHSSSFMSFKTIAQHLYTSAFQRLLDTTLLDVNMLVDSKTTMDCNGSSLRPRIRGQNERSSLPSGDSNQHYTGSWAWTDNRFHRYGRTDTGQFILWGCWQQALLAFPFTQYAKNYVLKAFDLGRAFLWKWTVNWRFVDEKIFLSREFAWSLLLGHAFTLSLFILTRWIK